MIFDIPALIEYLSAVVTLEPGDVITTGTPAGVGMRRTPPRFLRAGDTVAIEITGIGTLPEPSGAPRRVNSRGDAEARRRNTYSGPQPFQLLSESAKSVQSA